MRTMDLKNEQKVRIDVESNYGGGGGGNYLQKFRLYETRSVWLFDLVAVCLFEREFWFLFFACLCEIWNAELLIFDWWRFFWFR